MSAGPEYVDGRYRAERRANLLVQRPRGGQILSALQLPFFQLSPPAGYGVLTTIGRRTGKERRRCVRAIHRDGRVYLVAIGGAHSRWVMNVRANPDVRLRLRDGRFSGRARTLRDSAEVGEATERFCGTVMPFDYLTCIVHRKGRPTRAKIDELLRTWCEGGTPLVVEDLARA